jgi:hypothetical protein
MILTRTTLMAALLVMALGLSACAGTTLSTEVYPTPRPVDLPVGIDEGLLYRGWDGGHPFRLFAFILNPAGIVADLLWNQPTYTIASQAPELFGYTNQDEAYRQEFVNKWKYSWTSPRGFMGPEGRILY